jgi:ParB family transcriptional regulator, chromosome partitioning protein
LSYTSIRKRRATKIEKGQEILNMRVLLDDIKIGSRVRKEVGNIDDLKDSMSRHGLLQPIVIDPQYNLIAGFRRYRAARVLGWDSIEARVVDAESRKDRITMEIEENTTRRDFNSEEMEKAKKLMDLYNREGVFSSFVAWFVSWK